MDGRSRGIGGWLVASRLAVRMEDTLQVFALRAVRFIGERELATALPQTRDSVQVRIALDADADVLSAQYLCDTIVTSPARAAPQFWPGIPWKTKP
jgi:hypothetical protein